ncbi:MAG: RluA family pseudouridine synthase [Spirochaetes bacterium]|nr:RluA family pseudouridine synthase [Spirochaetota bacterium]
MSDETEYIKSGGGRKNPIIHESIVDLDGIGERIDHYLGRRFTYHSRTEWQSIIEQGVVRLNGIIPKSRQRLKKGDRVVYQIHDLIEPVVDKRVRILYDDGDIIACNKPADLPVIPSGKYHHNTLYGIMCKKLKLSPRLVNRIDRETSGIVLMARTEQGARLMQNIIATGKIHKIYAVIVKGEVKRKSFIVRGNIGRVQDPQYRMMQAFTPEGKYSRTDFRLVAQKNGYALLLCRIHTGRTHQIRVHLREEGLSVVGDKVYGAKGAEIFQMFLKEGNSDNVLREVDLPRQALHAFKLCFIHPKTGERLVIKAPLPKDMREFAKAKGLL